MTPKQAAQTVALLAAAYPYAKVTVDTSQVYESMLGDLDFEVTKQAVARLVTTSKFMPTIAEIRESATALRLGPPRTGGEAWADANQMVRLVGRYGTPKWSDPILAETMRLWGAWRDFCNSPEDDPGGRARFIEMYDQLAARKRADVVSGIALPAPKTEEPKQIRGARFMALVEKVGPLDVTVLASSAMPKTVTRRPESKFAGRTLTADEIDAALESA